MREPIIPGNETSRVKALYSCSALDTPAEERFDQLTRSIKVIADVPIALISLVDGDRQWFKSRQGLDLEQTARGISFCGHTILEDGVLEVFDTAADHRFHDNPLVIGDPHIRFYAGIPLRSPDGFPVGTLCILDRVPRRLTDAERLTLQVLGHCVERELFHLEEDSRALALLKTREIGEIIVRAQTEFIGQTGVDRARAFEGFLKDMLRVTESEFGFIGEVVGDKADAPYLSVRAMGTMSDNPVIDAFLDEHGDAFPELQSLDSLYGVTLRTGKPVISNEPATDPRRAGLPFGYPSIDSYFGVPVHSNGELVAMIGLANREGGYAESMLSPLRPVLVTFGQIIDADRIRRQRRAALNELDRFKKVLDQTMDAVFMIDPETLLHTYVNEGAVRQLGYSREELLNMRPFDIKPSCSEAQFRKSVEPLLNGHTDSVCLETTHRAKNGEEFPVDIVRQYVSFDAESACFFSIIRNVSKRKQAEQALRRERDFNAAMLTTANAMIIVVDHEGRVTRINNRAEQIIGRRDQEVRGRLFWELLGDDPARTIHQKAFERILGGKRMSRFKAHWPLPDGSRRLFDWSGAAEIDDDGKLRHVISLGIDITKRERAEAALIEARDAAQRANRAKSEFLASMSHELRTPLNAIIGFAQIVQMDLKGPQFDKQQDALRQVLTGSHYLLALIDQILDLARVEAGRINLEISDVPLNQLLDESVAITRPMAEARGIDVHLDLDTSADIHVRADPTRLKQVLLNLLSNGVKYNRDHGRVVLSVNVALETVRILVADTGQGIPENRCQDLFKPFERLGAEATGVEGTGLGLAITRQLVELMGGTIGCTSVVGEGSTFWFDIPLAAAHVAVKAKGQGKSMTRARTAFDRARRGRIVYIENNLANQVLMKNIVARMNGMALEIHGEAEAALARILEDPPNLVLLDISLQGFDGLQALRRLKASRRTERIPIIAVCADAMVDSIRDGLEPMFDQYVTKPLSVEKMIQLIESHLMVN